MKIQYVSKTGRVFDNKVDCELDERPKIKVGDWVVNVNDSWDKAWRVNRVTEKEVFLNENDCGKIKEYDFGYYIDKMKVTEDKELIKKGIEHLLKIKL
jgi:hypothetical protein